MTVGVTDDQVLVFAPSGRDASLTEHILRRADIPCRTCADIEELCRIVEDEGAAVLLLAEEVLVPRTLAPLQSLLERQPAWSDIPVVVFTGRREELEARPRIKRLVATLGNVTLLDRPVRPITMLSTVRSALRARHRQYASRAELIAQRAAVQQRDEFLAMLGHELRNPLGAILLALEVLERGTPDETKYRAIVTRQARHLGRLVDDLLDVARVTSGKIVLQKTRCDLRDILRRGLQSQDAAVQQQRLRATCVVPDRDVLVDVDPVRIEQVISNLVTNAIKYTPEGGRIDLALAVEGAQAVIRVRDDGVGIAPEMQQRVFELFAQSETTIDRARGGLGIGLTLVRKLVELHGGEVTVHSEGRGRGTEFVVRLPRAEVPALEAATTPTPVPTHARDILLVEDNLDSSEALCALLEHLGHNVEAVGDGPSAVDVAVAHHPTVLIIDIGLPGIDGYEVARRIRAQLGSDVMLIALTGYGQPEDRRRALAAGFDHHLTKPVDPRSLGRLLAG